MKTDILKEKFEDCYLTHSFKRINSTHPIDIYVGYNENGNKSFRIIANAQVENVESTKMIEVNITRRTDNKLSLNFDLLDDNMSDIYYQFCMDIIQKTSSLTDYSPIQFVIERWKQWIKMFKNPHSLIMNENEIRGLLGELIYLHDYMFEKYGIDDSLKAWVGSTFSHKDFEIFNTWYEIKTVRENSLNVEISSIEQLESLYEGELVIVRLEPSNESVISKISLNNYIKMIEQKLLNKDLVQDFYAKLEQRNYFYVEEYDKYIYTIKNIERYRVFGDFPRVKSKELKDGIVRVSYQISIDKIKEYSIGGE